MVISTIQTLIGAEGNQLNTVNTLANSLLLQSWVHSYNNMCYNPHIYRHEQIHSTLDLVLTSDENMINHNIKYYD